MANPPTLCLYVMGTPSDRVMRQHGSFEPWFARLFADHQVAVEVFDGTSGQVPARWAEYDGVVITGSRSSLTTPEPWMEVAIELVRDAYSARLPLLGVCFGHQLIGAAFGGQVVRNPTGWHLSTRPIQLSGAGRDDALFDGLPERFPVNVSHQDIVDADSLSPLNGIRVLAGQERVPVAAVAAGPSIRGVQFHPEFTGAITRSVIQGYHRALADESEHHGRPEDHPDRLLRDTGDTPLGEQVLHNFVRHFVGPRARARPSA